MDTRTKGGFADDAVVSILKGGKNHGLSKTELEISALRIALSDAEKVMTKVDAAIGQGFLDPRSQIADTRLDYSEPFTSRLAAIDSTTRTTKPDGHK